MSSTANLVVLLLGLAAMLLLGAGAGAAVVVLRMRRSREALDWERAWLLTETNPREGLTKFGSLVKRYRKQTTTRAAPRLSQAYLGQGLCLIRLREYGEAEEAISRAAEAADLAPADEAKVALAYLTQPPTPMRRGAVEAYARYLTLPAECRDPNLEPTLREALRRALDLPANATADEVKRVLTLAGAAADAAPHLDDVQYALGVASGRAGRWREAVPPLRKAVAAAPDRAERHRALAVALLRSGDERSARAAFLEAYRLAPDPVAARDAGLACWKAVEEPFTEAEAVVAGSRSPLMLAHDLLRDATQQGAGDATTWAALGQAQARLGQRTEAVESLEQAVALGTRSAPVYGLLAECRLDMGQKEAARQALNEALQLDAAYEPALRLAAALDFTDGRYADALGAYRRLPGTETDDTHAPRLARCQLEAGDPAEAVRLLVGRSPLDASSRLTLGRAHARLGRWDEALAALETGDVGRASVEYRYYLANALGANGRRAEAEQLLSGLENDPQWGLKVRRIIAHLKLLSGDTQAAEAWYQSAGGPSALDLGRVALVKRDAAAAQTHFSQALDAHADNPAAHLGLALAWAELGELTMLKSLVDDPDLGRWAAEPLGHRAYDERDHAAALPALEKALQAGGRRSSRLLCRLAAVYLQHGRYRDALPHLVELSRRHQRSATVRHNLAVCRYHLGRDHFRHKRWEPARAEWARCYHLLKPLAPQEAAAVRQGQQEAGYRAAAQMLAATPPTELERAAQIFREGCQSEPDDARWWLGAGLAAALAGDHATAAPCFARAEELAPGRPGFALGTGLSLLAAGRYDEANAALQRVLQAAVEQPKTPPLFPVAARFARATVQARQKHWSAAADELRPLLTHPLLRSSQRIGPGDVAQAMAAYYALGGDRDRATAVAKEHLPNQPGIGGLLLGTVQAEAGDYAGAAATLGPVYETQRDPALGELIASCLLNAAAERVRAGDIDGAVPHVTQAFTFHGTDRVARRFRDALAFAQQFRQLDVTRLDDTIRQCEALAQSDGSSSLLLRALGVLYHRKALACESTPSGADAAWNRCLGFWRQRVFVNESFWSGYVEEYNAGKGKRERVKDDDVAEWRKDLPNSFAQAHGDYAGRALRQSDRDGLKRHLRLIWEWSPDYQPPKEFLLGDLGEVNDEIAAVLEEALSLVKGEARKTLAGVVANGQANQAARAAQEVKPATDEGVASLNQAALLLNMAGQMAGPAVQALNSAGDATGLIRVLPSSKSALEQALALADQAVSLAERAVSCMDRALHRATDAVTLLRKARNLAPDNAELAQAVPMFEQMQQTARENRTAFKEHAYTIRSQRDMVSSNLDQVRQLAVRAGVFY